MTSSTTTPGTRGGWRPNSGRKNTLGETERRDVRLATTLIDLALRVGEGNFANGVRVLLMEGARLRAHVVGEGELPPTGEDILALCDGKWRICQAKIETGGKLVFINATSGKVCEATRWRLLPDDIITI